MRADGFGERGMGPVGHQLLRLLLHDGRVDRPPQPRLHVHLDDAQTGRGHHFKHLHSRNDLLQKLVRPDDGGHQAEADGLGGCRRLPEEEHLVDGQVSGCREGVRGEALGNLPEPGVVSGKGGLKDII